MIRAHFFIVKLIENIKFISRKKDMVYIYFNPILLHRRRHRRHHHFALPVDAFLMHWPN